MENSDANKRIFLTLTYVYSTSSSTHTQDCPVFFPALRTLPRTNPIHPRARCIPPPLQLQTHSTTLRPNPHVNIPSLSLSRLLHYTRKQIRLRFPTIQGFLFSLTLQAIHYVIMQSSLSGSLLEKFP